MLENVINYEDIPSNFYDKENYLSQGSRAICFKVDDSVFKLFAFGTQPSIEQLSKFSTINIPQINMPTKVILENNNLIGYFQKYITGRNLSMNDDLDLPISTFINQINILENSVKTLTDLKIKMGDINPQNMILTENNELYFIDTDAYMFDESITLKDNIKEFNKGFISLIFKIMQDHHLYSCKDKYPELVNLYELYKNGDMILSDFLIKYKNYIEINKGYTITTINDFKQLSNDMLVQDIITR